MKTKKDKIQYNQKQLIQDNGYLKSKRALFADFSKFVFAKIFCIILSVALVFGLIPSLNKVNITPALADDNTEQAANETNNNDDEGAVENDEDTSSETTKDEQSEQLVENTIEEESADKSSAEKPSEKDENESFGSTDDNVDLSSVDSGTSSYMNYFTAELTSDQQSCTLHGTDKTAVSDVIDSLNIEGIVDDVYVSSNTDGTGDAPKDANNNDIISVTKGFFDYYIAANEEFSDEYGLVVTLADESKYVITLKDEQIATLEEEEEIKEEEGAEGEATEEESTEGEATEEESEEKAEDKEETSENILNATNNLLSNEMLGTNAEENANVISVTVGSTTNNYTTWDAGWNYAKSQATSTSSNISVKALADMQCSSYVSFEGTKGTFNFNLNGKTVTGPSGEAIFSCYGNKNGVTLNISGSGTLKGNGTTGTNKIIQANGYNFKINITGKSESEKIIIKDCHSYGSSWGSGGGSVMTINYTTTVTIKNTTIQDCSSTGWGGAFTLLDSGSLILDSGTLISNCTANEAAAAYLYTSSTFTMNAGAKIEKCSGSTWAGALSCVGSTKMYIRGGEICNCTGAYMGAILAQAASGNYFEMTGGYIHDNTATNSSYTGAAGGIGFDNTSGTVKFGGDAKVYNNYVGSASDTLVERNVGINSSKAPKISMCTGSYVLKNGAKIGIYTYTAPTTSTPVTFTTGSYSADYSSYFTSDRSSCYSVLADTSNNIAIGTNKFGVKYDADSIYANYGTWTLAWSIAQSKMAAGSSAKPVTVTTLSSQATCNGTPTLSTAGTYTFNTGGYTTTAYSASRMFVLNSGVTLNFKGNGWASGNGSYSGDGGFAYCNAGSTLNVSGGTIMSFTATRGGAIAATGKNTKVTMTGGTIRSCTASQDRGNTGAGVLVLDGATFSMSAGTISDCTATVSCGSAVVCASMDSSLIATFNLSGTAIIKNNKANGTLGSSGKAAIMIQGAYAKMNMTGGTVQNNTATRYCGGIEIDSGTFEMSAGTIDGNSAPIAAGFEVWNGSNNNPKCTITGGTISNNQATNGDGGGVWINAGTHTYSGLTVKNNTASGNGGGIAYYNSDATFTLTNCTVQSNTATKGNGAGVYYSAGTLTVGGTTKINNNTNASSKGDLYVCTGQTIKMSSLTTGASIYVATQTSPTNTSPVTFTQGTYTSDYSGYFDSNMSGYSVCFIDTNKNLALGIPSVGVKYSTDDAYSLFGLWSVGWSFAQSKMSAGSSAKNVDVRAEADSLACNGTATISTKGTYNFYTNGKTITTASNSRMFVTDSGVTLNILGSGRMKGNGTYSEHGGFCYVNSGSTVNVNGTSNYKPTFSGFTAEWGGFFAVAGTLKVTYCKFTSGKANVHGGWAITEGSSAVINMEAGTEICSCNGVNGGVYTSLLSTGSIFTINDGSIHDNTATKYGLLSLCNTATGAYAGGNKLIINGGSIYNNSSANCGAIFLQGAGEYFEMYGGSIYDNKATESSSDSAGGIMAFNNGAGTSKTTLGGTAKVYNNTRYTGSGYEESNVGVIKSGISVTRYIEISSNKPLVSGAQIGIYTITAPAVSSPVQFTSGTYTADYSQYFTSDREGFSALLTDSSNNIAIGYAALNVKSSTEQTYKSYATWDGGWDAAKAKATAATSKTADVQTPTDCTATSTVTVNDGYTYNFDLNGTKLTADEDRIFNVSSGTLNIKDSSSTISNEPGASGNGNISGKNFTDTGGLAIVSGGTLNITGGTFDNFNATNDNTVGGCINATDGNLSISNSTFKDCSATDSGGVLSCEKSGSITNCLFAYNSSNNSAGAIRLVATTDQTFTFSSDKFNNNQADSNGGAVWVSNGFSANFDGCTFQSNKSKESDKNAGGGAISFRNSGSGTIKNSSFSQNETVNDGGAVAIENGSLTIEGSTFDSNEAGTDGTGNGGAIFIENSETSSVTINSILVQNNTAATSGAGIYFTGKTFTLGNSSALDAADPEVVTNIKIINNTNASGKGDSCKGDLFINYNKSITLSHTFAQGDSIGVKLASTTGTFSNVCSTNYSSYFVSNNSDYPTVNYNTYDAASSNYHKLEVLNSFTITKNEYTGVYDKGSHTSTVTSDYSSGTTITYSTSQGGEYSENAPSFTDAGDHVTYWKAEADGYSPQNGTLTTKISKATLQSSDFTYNKPSNCVYSASDKAATITKKSDIVGIGDITITYKKSGTATNPYHVGDYVCEISVAEGKNWNAATLTSDDWDFSITQAPLTITWTNASVRDYDGQRSTVSATASGYIGSDGAQATMSGHDEYKAGTYTAIITLVGNTGTDINDYSYSNSKEYTINKKALSANIQAGKITSQAYDKTQLVKNVASDALSLDGVVTPVTGTKDEVTANFDHMMFNNSSAGANKIVSVYGVSLAGDDCSNYSISNTLTNKQTDAVITPKEVSISYTLPTSDKLKYDGTEKTGLCSASVPDTERCSGDICTVTLETKAIAGKNVYDACDHTLVATIENENYAIKKNAEICNYTITQKEVSVISVDVKYSQVYDGTTKIAYGIDAIAISGVINADLNAVFAMPKTASYADSSVGENKNVYLGSCYLDGSRSSNYYLTASSGSFGPSDSTQHWNKINKKTLNEFVWFGTDDRVYDGNYSNVYAKAAGVISGDSVELAVEGGSQKNAATHTATITSMGGLSAGNYELAGTTSTTYTITPATLTATFLGTDICFKDTLPASTAFISVVGFVNGESKETPGIEYKNPEVKYNEDPSYYKVGEYTMTPEGGSAKNYTFTYQSGVLAVKSRTFDWVDAEEVICDYDGQEHWVKITKKGTETATLNVTWYKTQEDALMKKNPQSEATHYIDVVSGAVQWFRVESEGYTTWVSSKTVTIKPINLSYEVSTKESKTTKVYDGSTDASDYMDITFSPLERDKGMVDVQANLNFNSADAAQAKKSVIVTNDKLVGSRAGNYKIHVSKTSWESNVVIQPKHVTPTWLNAEEADLVYSGASKNVTCSLSETCDADLSKENIRTVGGGGKEVGAYTATGTIINANYTFNTQGSYEPGSAQTTYNITKASLKAMYVGETVNVGGVATGPVKVTGFVGGETPTNSDGENSVSSVEGYVAPVMENLITTTIGTFPDKVPSKGQAKNYSFDYVSGTLEVIEAGKAYINAVSNGYSGTYDATSHSVAVTSVQHSTQGTIDVSQCNVEYFSDEGYQTSTGPERTDVTSETIYIKISYPKDEPTLTTYSRADITISQKPVNVGWTNYSDLVYNGYDQTVNASVDEYVCSADKGKVKVVATDNVKKDAGTYTASASSLADVQNDEQKAQNYILNSVDASMSKVFVVSPRAITLTSSTPDPHTYDGTEFKDNVVEDKLTKDMTSAGFVGTDTWTYTTTASITNVGEVTNTFTYQITQGLASNYVISTVEGKLTVVANSTQVEVTVVGNNNKIIESDEDKYPYYDGKKKSVTGYEITNISSSLYKKSDVKCTDELMTASGTDAGTYNMGLKGTGQAGCNFQNINNNFSNVIFNVTDGYVTISKRPITLRSDDGTKTYDGDALVKHSVSVTSDLKWVSYESGATEGANYSYTGSITNVDDSATENNIFSISSYFENTKSTNYDIAIEYGDLKVTPRPITLISATDYSIYDGNEHFNHDMTVESGSWAKEEEASQVVFENWASQTKATYSFKDATPKGVDNSYTIRYPSEKFQHNYTCTTNYGTLYVAKRPVSLKSVSASKVYDGEPLTAHEVTEGQYKFAEGEGATYSYSSSITNVSESPMDNEFSYELYKTTEGGHKITDEKNYDITVEPWGTLSITKATPNSDTFKYTSIPTTQYDRKTRQASISLIDKYAQTGSTCTITYRYYSVVGGKETYLGDNETPIDAGDYKVKIKVSKSNNFNDSEGEITASTWTIRILKREVKAATKDNEEFVYDGQKHYSTDVTLTDFVPEEKEYISTRGFNYVTNVAEGDIKNTFECYTKDTVEKSTANLANYEIEYKFGYIKVVERHITLTSESESKTYDGSDLKNKNVTSSWDNDPDKPGFVENWSKGQDGADYTVTGAIKDKGTTPNKFTYELWDNTAESNYVISIEEGTLEIKPITEQVTVRITGKTLDDITYDAENHSVSGYDVEAQPSGEKAAGTLYLDRKSEFMSHDGTETVNGTDVNEYNFGLAADQFSNTTQNFTNVVFEVVKDGGFKIVPRNVTYTGETNLTDYVYSGETQKITGIQVEQEGENTGLLISKGHTFSTSQGLTYEASGKDVQNLEPYVGEFYGQPYITNSKGGVVSSNYSFTTVTGKLKINYKDMTVLPDDVSVIYDGKVVPTTTYSAKHFGMVDDQKLNYTYTTDPTPAKNIGEYTIKVGGDEYQTNYHVSYGTGKLKIKARPVTVTADDHKSYYTGQPLDPESEGLTATITGAAEGEEKLIKYTLTTPDNIIDTGSYEITASGEQIQHNYEVSFRSGTLSVVDKGKVVVKFNNNGHGMWIEDVCVKSGEHVTPPTDPTSTGYEFAGWFYDNEFSQAVDFENDVFEEDKTLYASWNEVNAARVQGYEFSTIQEAINSSYAKEDGAVVEVLHDVLEPSISLAADGGQVILDFKGHTVTGDIFVYGNTLEHHGFLTLRESSTECLGGLIGSITPYNVDPTVTGDLIYFKVETGYYSCNPTPYVDLSQNSVIKAEGEQLAKGFTCHIGKNTSTKASIIIADEIKCLTEVGSEIPESDVRKVVEEITKSTTTGLSQSIDEDVAKELMQEAEVKEEHKKDPGNVIVIEMIITVKAIKSDISSVDNPYIEYAISPSALVTVTNNQGKILSQTIDTIDNSKLNGNYFKVNLPAVGDFEPREVVHISKGGTVIDVFHKSGTYMFGYDCESKCISLDITEFSEVIISANVNYGALTFVDNFEGSTQFYKQNEELGKDCKLKSLEFAHTGYHFVEWATRADGTGQTYTNEETVSLNSDKVLYAQWAPNNYFVHFDGNGADSGNMPDQKFVYDAEAACLSANAFTKGYEVFLGWSSVPEGDIIYNDGAAVQNLTTEENGTVTLYAKWDHGEQYEAWLAAQAAANQTAPTGDNTLPFVSWVRRTFAF